MKKLSEELETLVINLSVNLKMFFTIQAWIAFFLKRKNTNRAEKDVDKGEINYLKNALILQILWEWKEEKIQK